MIGKTGLKWKLYSHLEEKVDGFKTLSFEF